MAERKVRISREAAQDLDDIWDYTAQVWSPAQAETYITGIRRTIRTIGDMPEIGRVRPEITPQVRTHPSAEHLIVYQFDDDTVTILRVLHKRRNWGAILSD